MPVNRLVALVRLAAAYRVEACFIAALAFTLANQPDDRRHRTFELNTATVRHEVVHEARSVRVVPSMQPVRPVRVVAPRAPKTFVMKTDSAAFSFCSATPNVAGAAGSGGSCRIIRITPTSSGVVISKTTAAGT